MHTNSAHTANLLRVMGHRGDMGLQSCRDMVALMLGYCGIDDLGPVQPTQAASKCIACLSRPARVIRFWAAIPTSLARATYTSEQGSVSFDAAEVKPGPAEDSHEDVPASALGSSSSLVTCTTVAQPMASEPAPLDTLRKRIPVALYHSRMILLCILAVAFLPYA